MEQKINLEGQEYSVKGTSLFVNGNLLKDYSDRTSELVGIKRNNNFLILETKEKKFLQIDLIGIIHMTY